MRFCHWIGWMFAANLALCAQAETLLFLSLAAEQRIDTYDLGESDGQLTKRGSFKTSGNPGAMCVNPGGTRLYVAMRSSGSIGVFAISQTGELTSLGESRMDADPSYLSVDPTGEYLVSAYYAAGQVAVHAINQEGRLSERPVQTLVTDQNAHAAVFDPSGKYVFVPHTRPNAIFQFHFDSQNGTLRANDPEKLTRPANTGPRHLWFHPGGKYVYGSDEQGSSVTAYRFDPATGQLATMQTLSSLPAEEVVQRNSTSDIEVHPSGRFVYLANRGHDTIAGYAIDDRTGQLSWIGNVPTESVTRSFNISPDGRYLVAAGQKSGRLAVFQIEEDGELRRLHTIEAGENPWWVQIIDSPAK